MIFFLDENLDQNLKKHLRSIFSDTTDDHRFIGPAELSTRGMKDIELFGKVATEGAHVFVTADLAQMKRPPEREACREAGLHWVGVHQVHSRGFHIVAGPASTLIHALPFVIDEIRTATAPTMFQLRKSQRQTAHVFEACRKL